MLTHINFFVKRIFIQINHVSGTRFEKSLEREIQFNPIYFLLGYQINIINWNYAFNTRGEKRGHDANECRNFIRFLVNNVIYETNKTNLKGQFYIFI